MVDRIVLFAAQGFGIGMVPKAQGTFGTLLGVVWAVALILTGNFWAFLFGSLAGLGFAVFACDRAEHILRQHDPPSVVIDEIAAFPLCYLGLGVIWLRMGHWPTRALCTDPRFWWFSLLAFGAFRLFDIWKPGPIGLSQKLPGGWGVVVDDLLAGVTAGLVMTIVDWFGTLHFALPV